MNGKNYLWGFLGLSILAALIYLIVNRTHNPAPIDEDAVTFQDVDCGSGRMASRYKNPGKMFPVIMRDYSTNVKVTTDILTSLLGDSSGSTAFDVEASNKAQRLRAELDQDNAFYENQLKALFFEVNRRPCDDSLSSLYANYVKEMSFKVLQMKEFLADVTTPAAEVKDPEDKTHTQIVVIDTARHEVKKPTGIVKPDQLVIIREKNKLKRAIKLFDDKLVKANEFKRLPLTIRK